MTTVLEREVYSEAEAARLLEVAPSTLRYWLQGGERRGVVYPPIIRPEPVDRRWVTWAEFIEAGWLKTYRRDKRIPMDELRDFISLLRDRMGVPYPLAHKTPFVSGKRLVFQLQKESDLHPEFRLVDDQMMLTYAGRMFMEKVEWSGGVASGWRPAEDPKSTVLVRPDVRFARPAVGGISTASLYEEAEGAGASDEELAEVFRLPVRDIRWAIAYETERRAKGHAA